MSSVKGGFCKSYPVPGTKSLSLRWSRAGERTGGNADDAPTATANSTCGLAILPTRQSHMYGFENRQSAPDWAFVALITNRGASGKSCSVACLKRREL